MLTDLQKKAVQAIVNIFETGKPLGDYGKVTLLPNDTGHHVYGDRDCGCLRQNIRYVI